MADSAKDLQLRELNDSILQLNKRIDALLAVIEESQVQFATAGGIYVVYSRILFSNTRLDYKQLYKLLYDEKWKRGFLGKRLFLLRLPMAIGKPYSERNYKISTKTL